MSHAIYSTIKDRIKARLHDPNLSDSSLESIINNARDQMVRDIKPSFLVKSKTFLSVIDQATYYITGVPQQSVREIVDVSNERPLIAETELDLNSLDIDREDGSDPCIYILGDISYILSQNVAASVVAVVSDSAADITQKALIRGLVSGIEVTEEVTLTGTVAANSTNTYDISGLISITLDSTCTGTISTSTTAGAVTNVKIIPSRLYTEYLPITLWGTPSTADDIFRLEYYKELPYLENNADPLGIPSTWISLLIDISLIEAHRQGYEFQPSELLLRSVKADLKDFSAKYQRSRKKYMSMVKDRNSLDPFAKLRSTKPVG